MYMYQEIPDVVGSLESDGGLLGSVVNLSSYAIVVVTVLDNQCVMIEPNILHSIRGRALVPVSISQSRKSNSAFCLFSALLRRYLKALT
ncbi:hypothetical protein MPTK1_3g03500 [Marchantia polymorpha subsp. ruderalis]|uniref:Uncharacterized protein n=2 Tax=Marchantia polymorpha TaxID=3197 RepID=A0AAF6AX22_MARPO|nr:hypothetical protein MARPO_0022s0182 [Marchantia polymorpha]BBN04306.1 hypothetical protein Mp_3g03500 [Marchantia polymorpha subsp. ruderalis]|eukprot:PTQ44099.1 hypothetical protein MARPO_0022s0182 [Marchantia polymorpha]